MLLEKFIKPVGILTMKMASIKKGTAKRLHDYCRAGEKHDNMVNRLIDVLEEEKANVNLTDGTISRLLGFCECKDVDEAINVLLDRCRRIV